MKTLIHSGRVLGYTPITVKQVFPVNQELKRLLRTYVGDEIPDRIYVMAPDPDYIDLLKKAGFTFEELRKDSWLVKRICGESVYADQYPPYGWVDCMLMRVYVLESLKDDIGVLVHEAVHYCIHAEGLKELYDIEEEVARAIEYFARNRCPPVPVKLFAKALERKEILENLNNLLYAMGVIVDIDDYFNDSEVYKSDTLKIKLMLGELIDAMKFRRIHPCDVAKILRGELCYESDGSL